MEIDRIVFQNVKIEFHDDVELSAQEAQFFMGYVQRAVGQAFAVINGDMEIKEMKFQAQAEFEPPEEE